MQPCPVPEFSGATEADLVAYAIKLQAELEICNKKLERQRSWYNQVTRELDEES